MAQLPLLVRDDVAVSQLQSATPADWPVQPGWQGLLNAFWSSRSGLGLLDFLRDRLAAGAPIYPPQPMRALELVAPEDVRVVILGQDPYHGAGQAEGLAFSVAPGVRPPPSLRNIFKELQRDLGVPEPVSGSLVGWAGQGVLLLNTCLTVEDGLPASHEGRGWEALTDALVRACASTGQAKAFLLWGAHAQKKAALVEGHDHLVLRSNHPSPLSARRGPVPFLGCGHFSAVNQWLLGRGLPSVVWSDAVLARC